MFRTKKSLIIVLIMLSISVFTACDSEIFRQESVSAKATVKATESLTEISSALKTTELTLTDKETTAEIKTKTEKATTKSASESVTSTLTAADISTALEITEKIELNNKHNKLKPKIKDKKVKEDKKFFDNAVFIGDSVSLGLKNYVTNQRNNGKECLGKAKFLVAGCMGYTNSLGAIGKQNTIHPKYNGKEVMVDDGVKLIGAEKAFIMLGLNDFCAYPLETGIKNAEIFVNRIIEKNPGIEIYIQSVTPVISAKERGKFNNDSINKFNEALFRLCEENSWTYVDIASVMKNENGCFKDEYCCDKDAQGVHMTYSAYRVWIDCLNEKF